MRCRDHVSHYIKDSELFDYFAELSGPDADGARRIQEAVQREVGARRSGLTLDVGSGNGWFARRNNESEQTVVSCDISARNLRRLKETVGGNSHAVAADAHHMPFRNDAFDTIVVSEMLEHVNDPAVVLVEMRRIARTSSRIIVSTPYRETLRLSLCIHCNLPTPVNAHLHSFDEMILRDLLASTGWTLRRIRILQNKIFISLRLSYLVRFLPYLLWRFLDNLFLLLSDKANTILLTASKE